MPITSITQVIEELNAIISICENKGSRQGYFAALYCSMTKAVQNGIQQNVFEDPARMEKLDVIFANRYIAAWHSYQLKEACTSSWQLAFDACENENLIVLQHLILGINTHINLDLAIAAAATAPGQSIFAMQKDFESINGIISELTNNVQGKLEKIWWPMMLVRSVVNGKDKAVINFSITAARKASWANAVALAIGEGNAAENYIVDIDKTVTMIGTGIIKPEWYKKIIITIVKWFEEKDIRKTIGLLK